MCVSIEGGRVASGATTLGAPQAGLKLPKRVAVDGSVLSVGPDCPQTRITRTAFISSVRQRGRRNLSFGGGCRRRLEPSGRNRMHALILHADEHLAAVYTGTPPSLPVFPSGSVHWKSFSPSLLCAAMIFSLLRPPWLDRRLGARPTSALGRPGKWHAEGAACRVPSATSDCAPCLLVVLCGGRAITSAVLYRFRSASTGDQMGRNYGVPSLAQTRSRAGFLFCPQSTHPHLGSRSLSLSANGHFRRPTALPTTASTSRTGDKEKPARPETGHFQISLCVSVRVLCASGASAVALDAPDSPRRRTRSPSAGFAGPVMIYIGPRGWLPPGHPGWLTAARWPLLRAR